MSACPTKTGPIWKTQTQKPLLQQEILQLHFNTCLLIITDYLLASKFGHLTHNYFVNHETQATLVLLSEKLAFFFCEQWTQLDPVFIESFQNSVRLTHLPCVYILALTTALQNGCWLPETSWSFHYR